MNLIQDCDITTKDVRLVEKGYGPELGMIKSKSTRSYILLVTSQVIEIPEELLRVNMDVTMSIDSMSINGLIFLMIITYDIYYRIAARLVTTRIKNVC